MTQYDRLHSMEIYNPSDEEIMKQQLDCLEKLYDFNATRPMSFRNVPSF